MWILRNKKAFCKVYFITKLYSHENSHSYLTNILTKYFKYSHIHIHKHIDTYKHKNTHTDTLSYTHIHTNIHTYT